MDKIKVELLLTLPQLGMLAKVLGNDAVAGATEVVRGKKTKPASVEDDEEFLVDDEVVEDDEFATEEDENTEPTIDKDFLRKELEKRKGKMTNIQKLFVKYKAKNLSAMKPAQFENFWADLQKIKP